MQANNKSLTNITSQLRGQLVASFDLEELRQLCFDLHLNYDELRGETLSAKVQALLIYLEQRHRLPDLVTILQQVRPQIDWAQFIAAEADAVPPFKGLQYFTEADAPLFFGRETLTAELAAHLGQHRFLVVVGASGSGKSSVVRAGLVPAVRRGQVVYNGQSSEHWSIHVITPGDEPLKALAASLTRDTESVTAMKQLLADMRHDSDSLDLWLFRKLSEQEGRLLLVVDQFEELFTQCDDPVARQLFVENLAQAVQSGKQGHLSLVLTLRADFYAHAVQLPRLVPLLENKQKIVEAMSRDELQQAIEKPAKAGNWQFQAGLVETILQDVGASDNRPPEPGALPLLSHALLATWQRREGRMLTLAGYHEAGGVRRAIATTADTLFEQLSEKEQSIARSIFIRLTELGAGTEDTRRRASLVELIPSTTEADEIQRVLARLADARLVTTGEDSAEVAHEALIREWPKLRQWLDEDRENLELHRQLTEAAEEWARRDRRDDSYLYRGNRLIAIEEGLLKDVTRLNSLEHAFIDASIERRNLETTQREAQRQRKLEQKSILDQLSGKAGRRGLNFLLPYLILTLIVAAVGAFIVTNLVSGSLQERFTNQLLDAGRVVTERIIEDENVRLQTLRIIASTEGVASALAANDSDALATLVPQIAANNTIDDVALVNLEGVEIYSWQSIPSQLNGNSRTDTDFLQIEDVNLVLEGFADETGDKRAFVAESSEGYLLYTVGPVYLDGQLVGALLVGTSLQQLVVDLTETAVARVTFYDRQGNVIATTLGDDAITNMQIPLEQYGLVQQQLEHPAEAREFVTRTLNEEETFVTRIESLNQTYQLAYGEWRLRQQSFGLFSVALPTNFIVNTAVTSRNLLSVVFALVAVVVLAIGFVLARRIILPIEKLAKSFEEE